MVTEAWTPLSRCPLQACEKHPGEVRPPRPLPLTCTWWPVPGWAGWECPGPWGGSALPSLPPAALPHSLLPSVCKVGDYIFGGFPFIF